LFARLPATALAELEALAHEVRINAGGWLFRQRQPGDHLFIVSSGRVELIVADAGTSRDSAWSARAPFSASWCSSPKESVCLLALRARPA
jgi:hypothetical protein